VWASAPIRLHSLLKLNHGNTAKRRIPTTIDILVIDPARTRMSGNYLGHLSENDPLHGYLQHDIQPQITGRTVVRRVF
jgi:hypothetical protein